MGIWRLSTRRPDIVGFIFGGRMLWQRLIINSCNCPFLSLPRRAYVAHFSRNSQPPDSPAQYIVSSATHHTQPAWRPSLHQRDAFVCPQRARALPRSRTPCTQALHELMHSVSTKKTHTISTRHPARFQPRPTLDQNWGTLSRPPRQSAQGCRSDRLSLLEATDL
ncbi:hypothetical protein BS50DRAFT_25135 [Corynespora cassiicola Philippines]|uniref:Uncharacterized protein n=1 Tax=Corynespora cassiicola Philippines TaxID=1448308 RepID=A0A2T2PAX8_CORCC|nr:hypothetical protein BS50DRAFT_25135 [Corynespora cassiicola Philippines]